MGQSSLLLGLATTFGMGLAAAAFQWVMIRRSRTLGIVATVIAAPIILLSPLAIPADERLARFLFAVASFALLSKLIDISSPKTKELPPSTLAWVKYVANPSSLVYRRLAKEPQSTREENVRRLKSGIPRFALGLSASVFAWIVAMKAALPFALEHSVKIVTTYVTVLGLFDIVSAIARLGGAPIRDPFHDIFTARTPAELWRRYNRTVGQWFEANFFEWFGGRRHPVRATLLVFALSSLIHEYVVGIALGKVQGWQTAFFMLQGVGVVLTLRWKPRGLMAGLGIAGTILFNLASSVLFVDALNKICPAYAGPGVLPTGVL